MEREQAIKFNILSLTQTCSFAQFACPKNRGYNFTTMSNNSLTAYFLATETWSNKPSFYQVSDPNYAAF